MDDNFIDNDNNSKNDPLTTILQSRRIPHGRSSKNTNRRAGGGGGRGKNKSSSNSVFNPLRALGLYQLYINVGSGRTTTAKGQKLRELLSFQPQAQSRSQSQSQSFLTIHNLTENDDGFIASIDLFGQVLGIGVLAGSRKGLRKIVDELEKTSTVIDDCADIEDDVNDNEDENDDEDDGNTNNESNGESEDHHAHQQRPDTALRDFESVNDDDDDDDDGTDGHLAAYSNQADKSAIELEDERINRRAKAFEKNAFRNPKFWMEWRSRSHESRPFPWPDNTNTISNGEDDDTNEKKNTASNDNDDDNDQNLPHNDRAYLIFSSNDCGKFEGTISSAKFGWDNLKVKGHKIKSQVGDCRLDWNDFD